MKRLSKKAMIYVVLGGIAIAALTLAWIESINHDLAVDITDLGIIVMLFALGSWLIAFFAYSVQALVWPGDAKGRDDRGKEYGFRRPKKLPTHVEFTKAEKRCLKTWAKSNPVPSRAYLVLLILFVPIVADVLLRNFFEALPTIVIWGVFILLVVIALGLVLRAGKLILSPWLNGFLPVIGKCASCGYDLNGLACEDDGCVACPECGAAWRLNYCELCFTRLPDGVEGRCTQCAGQAPEEPLPESTERGARE